MFVFENKYWISNMLCIMWQFTTLMATISTKATVGIGSTSISPVNHVKSLGVTLDDQLKLSKHVSNVTRSCFYQIRQLKHIRRYLDFQSAGTVVHSLVTSRVDYCDGLLAAAPVKQMDQLTRVLHAVTRLLLRVPCCDFNLCMKVRDQLHWLHMESEWHSSYVLWYSSVCMEWPLATSTSCAFQCLLTPTEVISDQQTKRSWRSLDPNYKHMVHECSASLDQPRGTLSPAIFEKKS